MRQNGGSAKRNEFAMTLVFVALGLLVVAAIGLALTSVLPPHVSGLISAICVIGASILLVAAGALRGDRKTR